MFVCVCCDLLGISTTLSFLWCVYVCACAWRLEDNLKALALLYGWSNSSHQTWLRTRWPLSHFTSSKGSRTENKAFHHGGKSAGNEETGRNLDGAGAPSLRESLPPCTQSVTALTSHLVENMKDLTRLSLPKWEREIQSPWGRREFIC